MTTSSSASMESNPNPAPKSGASSLICSGATSCKFRDAMILDFNSDVDMAMDLLSNSMAQASTKGLDVTVKFPQGHEAVFARLHKNRAGTGRGWALDNSSECI